MNPSAERPYLSIGEVLELLKDEFPDVSISRIRIFESHGLLALERTASGYRKFYDADVSHLRTILREQGAGDGPLARPSAASLAGARTGRAGSASSGTPSSGAASGGAEGRGAAVDAADDDHVELHQGELPGQPERRHPASYAGPPRQGAPRSQARPPSPEPADVEPRHLADPPSDPAAEMAGHDSGGHARSALERVDDAPPDMPTDVPTDAAVRLALVPIEQLPPSPASPPELAAPTGQAAPEPGPLSSRNPLAVNPSALSLTLDELCRTAGITAERVRELEGFGLIRGHGVFSTLYYDEDALLTCRLVADFAVHGVEPRHLRMYKLAADREAAFFEQVVTPQLRRRNADAKDRAIETLGELVRLGEQMRVVALRQVLRAAVDPS